MSNARQIATTVAAGFACAALAFTVLYSWWPHSSKPVPAIHTQYVGNQNDFLQKCSGVLKLDEMSGPIAVANCMGKIRGMSDGHSLTVQLASADPNNKGNISLWCVDERVTDQQLLDAVLTWTLAHTERYNVVTKGFVTDQSAAMAVMIASLHETFPCEKNK